MKKIIAGFLLGIILLVGNNTYAANYEMKELIPVDTETTIVSKHFSYKSFYYNKLAEDKETSQEKNFIIFKGIKNLTDEDRPISISIALFGEDKKNIGTINYCNSDEILKSKEEVSFSIEVEKEYLAEGKSAEDVKYISVISDNINCRKEGSQDFVGDTVEEIGMPKNKTFSDDTELFLKIVTGVFAILFILFLYKFLFTNAYNNMDGVDTRRKFVYENQKLKEEREAELRRNPPKPPEKKMEKTIEVLEAEEKEANSPKDSSELHDFFK